VSTRTLTLELIPAELPGIPRYSASQTKKALECLAAWWYDRRTDRPPETPAQALGLEAHKRLELKLDGIEYDPESGPLEDRAHCLDLERCARAELLAETALGVCARGPTVKSEWEFLLLLKVNGRPKLQLLGFIDVSDPWADVPLVQDLKTTSNWKYALSEADLLNDPQALIYAAAMLARRPDADAVDLTWIYVHSKNKRKILGACRSVQLSRARVDLGIRTLYEVIWQKMIKAEKRKTAPEGSPPQPCQSYGGCGFDAMRDGPCKQPAKMDPITFLRLSTD